MSRFRRLMSAFAAVVITALAAGGISQGAEPPFEINVILELTGQNAFLGSEELQTIHIIEGLVNESGGIRGRKIKFVVADDQSNPAVTVQLVSALVSKNVPAIIGFSLSATCSAAIPITAAKGPLTVCYTPAVILPPGSFAFGANGALADAFDVGITYLRERKWNRVAFIATTDASGQSSEVAINAALALPVNATMKLVAREHFNPGDVSVAAQVANIKAANPQAIYAAPTGTPFGTLLHALQDAGVDVPVYTSYSNTSDEQMKQYKQMLPTTLCASGLLGMVANSVGPGPIRDAQMRYQKAFAAAGIRPSAGANSSWDATMMMVDTFRALGTGATAPQLRAYLEGLHGWTGINGIYDFRTGKQRGIGQNGALAICWDPARNTFVASSRPGGTLPATAGLAAPRVLRSGNERAGVTARKE